MWLIWRQHGYIITWPNFMNYVKLQFSVSAIISMIIGIIAVYLKITIRKPWPKLLFHYSFTIHLKTKTELFIPWGYSFSLEGPIHQFTLSSSFSSLDSPFHNIASLAWSWSHGLPLPLPQSLIYSFHFILYLYFYTGTAASSWMSFWTWRCTVRNKLGW